MAARKIVAVITFTLASNFVITDQLVIPNGMTNAPLTTETERTEIQYGYTDNDNTKMTNRLKYNVEEYNKNNISRNDDEENEANANDDSILSLSTDKIGLNLKNNLRADNSRPGSEGTLSAKLQKDQMLLLKGDKNIKVDNSTFRGRVLQEESNERLKVYSLSDQLEGDKSRNKDMIAVTRLKRKVNDDEDDDLYIWDSCEGKEHLAVVNGEIKCVEVVIDNRLFEPLKSCPAGNRRIFINNVLVLCKKKIKKRRS